MSTLLFYCEQHMLIGATFSWFSFELIQIMWFCVSFSKGTQDQIKKTLKDYKGILTPHKI